MSRLAVATSGTDGDERCLCRDIWSLGCVVLEMFAGRRPWSDEEAIQAMFKVGLFRFGAFAARR